VNFALSGALTSQSVRGEYEKVPEVKERVNKALNELFKNAKISKATQALFSFFERKGNATAISNNMNVSNEAATKYVMLPELSFSFLILKGFKLNVTPISNAFTENTKFTGLVNYTPPTPPGAAPIRGLKLGRIVNGKAELLKSNGFPLKTENGKSIMVPPSQVVSTNAMNFNTNYAANNTNFERARNMLNRNWTAGKAMTWTPEEWAFVNEVMKNKRFTNRLGNKNKATQKLRNTFMKLLAVVQKKYEAAPKTMSPYQRIATHLNKEDRNFLRLFIKAGGTGFAIPNEHRRALNNMQNRDRATPTRRRTRWNAENGEIRYTKGRPRFPGGMASPAA
jgi:hypothetical protein